MPLADRTGQTRVCPNRSQDREREREMKDVILTIDKTPSTPTPFQALWAAFLLRSLSQEIHDALVSHRLACAHNAELILMTDLRRVVLDFLGQVGNRQAQSEKPRAAPAPATPPRKKKRELEEMESEPRPSRSKISHEPNMAKDTASPASIPNTPEQGFELKERTLEEATEQVWKVKPVDAVDTLVDMLVKDYGSLELATSLADRVAHLSVVQRLLFFLSRLY